MADESDREIREKTFGLGRLSMFKYKPDLREIEEILTGKVQPRVGDVVKGSPPEVTDERR